MRLPLECADIACAVASMYRTWLRTTPGKPCVVIQPQPFPVRLWVQRIRRGLLASCGRQRAFGEIDLRGGRTNIMGRSMTDPSLCISGDVRLVLA